MTPQERGSIFANYEYDINEAVQLYAEVLYSRTSSGFQIAPLPFDALADDVVISGDSYYNPFGYSFGGATGANPNLTVRLEAARQSLQQDLLRFEGGQGRHARPAVRLGMELRLHGWLQPPRPVEFGLRLPVPARSLGRVRPIVPDDNGTPGNTADDFVQCGTAANPIPQDQCTPVNIFNLAGSRDRSRRSARSARATSTDRAYTSKQASFAVDGKMFTMPAGDALASIQADYTELHGDFNVGLPRHGLCRRCT